MKFFEQQQPFIVIDELSCQRKKAEFCDIDLIVHQKCFKAHRNVLAANSKYFSSLFKSKKIIQERLVIEHCKNEAAFESFITYMYSGMIAIDWDNVEEQLKFAELFAMEKVTCYCEAFLRSSLHSTCCLYIARLSGKYKLSELENQTHDFVSNNIREVMRQNEVLMLTSRKLKVFVNKHRHNVSQEELLSLLCRWIEHDQELRLNQFPQLLSLINLQYINHSDLDKTIDSLDFLKYNPKCLYLLLIFLETNGIILQKYELQLKLLKAQFHCAIVEASDSNKVPECDVDDPGFTRHYLEEESDDNEILTDSDEFDPMSVKNNSKRILQSKNLHPHSIPVEKNENEEKKNVVITKNKEDKDISIEEKSTNEDDLTIQNSDNTNDKNTNELKCYMCSFCTDNSNSIANHLLTRHEMEVSCKCDMCNYVCKGIKKYSSHLKQHCKRPPYNCNDCSYSSKTMNHFAAHLCSHQYKCDNLPKNQCEAVSQVTENKDYKCIQCGLQFNRKAKLLRHELSHQGKKHLSDGQCQAINISLCPDEFNKPQSNDDDNKSSKHTHETKVSLSSVGILKCHICDYVTKIPQSLNYHISRYHVIIVTYKCNECDFTCKWAKQYNDHLKTHYDGPPYSCKHCGRNYVTISQFSDHLYNHRDDYPFECSYCTRRYRSKIGLVTHIRLHTGEKPFTCKVCGRCFHRKQSFQMHMSLHKNMKLSCDKCQYTTRSKKCLYLHNRIHNGKSFSCDFPDCSVKCTTKWALKKHKVSHSTDKPFKCKYCAVGFACLEYLNMHQKIHLDSYQFLCSFCEHSFSMRHKLVEHIKRHHSETPSKVAFTPRRKKVFRVNESDQMIYMKPEVSNSLEQDNKTITEVSSVLHVNDKRTTPSPAIHRLEIVALNSKDD